MNVSSKKKKNLIRAAIVAAIALILLIIGILSVRSVKKANALDLTIPYHDDSFHATELLDTTIQISNGFASSLCTSDDNINVSGGIEIAENEKAALLNLDDNQVLFAQNMYEQIYPASITKIMTAILALKHGNMSDIVTITEEMVALGEDSQVCGFVAGDQVSLNELLHGLLIYSGNDAAMAIASHIGGSIEGFVDLMNQEALSLGATKTHFANPHGLHDTNHYTTVYDVYLMFREAMKYQEFNDIIQLSGYNIHYRTNTAEGLIDTVMHLDSTDRYLLGQAKAPKNVTVLGGKTGTTDEAGSCLALLSQNAYGKPFITIILNARTKDALYSDMNQLLSKTNS